MLHNGARECGGYGRDTRDEVRSAEPRESAGMGPSSHGRPPLLKPTRPEGISGSSISCRSKLRELAFQGISKISLQLKTLIS